MRSALRSACVILSLLRVAPAGADPAVQDLAARTEIHPIPTVTVSVRQFLTGVRTSTNLGQFNVYNVIVDAYRGLDVLADHPRIDPTRLAIMGFSLGGVSALYSSMKRFQQIWSPRSVFAAHIPFYPGCATAYIGDTDIGIAPVRQFHGAVDDYTPVAPCRAYFEQLRAAGRDAVLVEYPNAHHCFDNRLGNKVPRIPKGAQSFRACRPKEEPLGTIVHAEFGERFTWTDPCLQTDAHTGYNEPAAKAARIAVKDFVRALFKLEH